MRTPSTVPADPTRDLPGDELPAPSLHLVEDARSEPAVRFEGATARLGVRDIWHDATFDVRPGEFVAILGPNGAGKSTLLKALLGLVPLSAGRVEVLGRLARRGSPAIGYLPQRRVFDSDIRVRGYDLVRLGLDGTRWGLPLPAVRWLGAAHAQRADEERRRVDEVISLVGATAYADRPIGEVSGGEQQRLLIAQALATRPRVLLLDEPLEGLDLPNQRAVSAVIRRIGQDEGVATLMVAHDVNPILPYLDRVIYVARGQVVCGRPEDVITTETLSRLYAAPVEVLRASDGRLVVVGQPEGSDPHFDEREARAHAAHA